MVITWLDIYDTHIHLVDKQHRILVDMINDLDAAKGMENEPKLIGELFFKLVDYTKYHFAQEESLMQKIKYPKINEQINQHKVFISKIVEMLETIKRGDVNISEKMNEFLKNWLIKHILGYDKELGKYYNIVTR